jgi:hypothetical protein
MITMRCDRYTYGTVKKEFNMVSVAIWSRAGRLADSGIAICGVFM